VSQTLTLPAAGLMTDPGPFTAAPDGGMLEAQNVVILRPGVMEPRPGAQLIADATLKANSDEAASCYVDASSNVFVWATFPWIIRYNGSTTITGPTSFIAGKIRTCPTGGRSLNTSENGVCTLPRQPASPASGSSTIAYRAGLPQPYAPWMFTVAGPGGYPAGANWLPAGESVAYRVTLRRHLANGTLVESAPSGRIVVTNSTAGALGVALNDVLGTGIYYAWSPNGVGALGYNDLMPGDELCIYRSPRLTGTPSDEMRLRAVLTYDTTYNGFTTIVNGVATQWFDGMDDSSWTGPALYTNGTQEGAAFGNFRPEYARDIALYNGMTFYAGAKTPQRLDLTLKRIGVFGGTGALLVTDPSQSMCSFGFQGDTLIGTNTILNATNIRYFSIGQVITTLATAPDAGSVTFPVGTYVTAVNVSTNTVTLSQNAGATGAATQCVAWDWVESSIANTRIYHYGNIGAVPQRYFNSSAESLDNRWNGDNATSLQLRCTGATPTSEIVCSWFQPDCTSAAFSVRSSKALAWNRYVDNTTGVTSEQLGGIAELQWSKLNEPEHLPIPYRTTVGDAAYAIRRIEVARNSLLVFKDDGLHQVFGQTPGALSFELLDRTIVIPAPKDDFGDEPCKWVGRFDDRVFAMTTRGPMQIGDAGAEPVGAPILESLRQRFQFAFGAGDESLRALMVDTQSRRVAFFYIAEDGANNSVGYVLDVESMTWTYWVLARPIADCVTVASVGAPLFVGDYFYGFFIEDRTMLDDATVAVPTMPTTYETWPGETCAVNTVTGTGPYTVTIAAGSEWTPAVGDMLIQSGVAHEVVSVTSATVFETDVAPTPASTATWRESYECRCVWLARTERNVGAEKHWRAVAFPFEKATLFSRYVSPTSSTGRMKSYFRGYRNTGAAIEAFVDADQSIGVTPWPLVPAYKPVAVPPAVARDWALRVGFSIRQAGVWFSTGGISVLFEGAEPGKVGR
jgi:hypothetical protein